MSLAIICSDEKILSEVSGALNREGAEVWTARDACLTFKSFPDAIAHVVLIDDEHSAITIGEQTSLVREALNGPRELLVCSTQPTPADRDALIECGASQVITPASWTASQIAERILAELILLRKPRFDSEFRGGTQIMQKLFAHIGTVAPLDEPVLVTGETGTGKELVARELHQLSARQGPMLAINCPELSPELLGSELFGHEKGAFTNANQPRKGLILEARTGTVFLDEIGDLDLIAQAKLLRVIEDKTLRPVGSNHWEKVQARFILATNRNLDEDSQVGKFRSDLFERIRGFTLELPPLRERKADIPLLVQHFVDEYSNQYEKRLKTPPGSLDWLFRYDWPGNVRELRSAVRKASAYADRAGNISSVMLQEAVRGRKRPSAQNSVSFDPTSETWRDVQKKLQAIYFRSVLASANGSKEVAAKLAGLSRAQLYEKLKEIDQ